MPTNLLYYGDNLDVMKRHIQDESVDLIYLDPPFNSNQNYNVLFAEQDGKRAEAQIRVFEDTWEWNETSERAYQDTVEASAQVADVMRAFRTFLGENNMLAYLAMMAPRLVELHRALKPTGSIYLHCDPTASHYLKMLMDAVFGPEHFLNEIVWKRTTAHSSAKRYGPVHDVILYYGRGETPIWTDIRLDYEQDYIDRYYKYDDGDGRLYWRADLCAAGVRHGSSGEVWRGCDPTAKGMHWKFTTATLDKLDAEGRIYWAKKGKGWPQYKRYREELKGRPLLDVWDDINRINPRAAERLGYPTQKPEDLLERIIEASSNEGDVVLDPFCGCGTTVSVAHRLKRQWIGIDITHLAITLIKHRLSDTYGNDLDLDVVGEPVALAGAQALAKDDPYQFQWWSLGLVGARPTEQKKGADKGIDGKLYFFDEQKGKAKQIIFSVKAGKVSVAHIRDLRGVIERESAAIGVFITMNKPTKPMRVEAVGAGFYESPGWNKKYPRIQILTIEELLDGKGVDCPPSRMAFKQAPRRKKKGKQGDLGI